MAMQLILIGALNAVLFVLLLIAIALIRSSNPRRIAAKAVEPDRREASRRQRRTARKAAKRAAKQGADLDRPTDEPRSTGRALDERDGDETADDQPVDPYDPAAPVAIPTAPAPDNRLFRLDHQPADPRPSHIRLVSGLNGSGPNRGELVGGVINALLPLGLSIQRLDALSSRLTSVDGRTVAVNADRLDDGRDHIEIVIDSTLAPEALIALRQWHAFELDTSDRVHISAQIH